VGLVNRNVKFLYLLFDLLFHIGVEAMLDMVSILHLAFILFALRLPKILNVQVLFI
jgi:hypothetical protein